MAFNTIRMFLGVVFVLPAAQCLHGQFAYVANTDSNNVSGYRIEPATGALTPIGAFPAGRNPGSLAADPSGRFLYVANVNSASLWVYAIDRASGALTKIAEVPTETAPFSIAVDRSGRFLYVANYISASVSAYRIDPAAGLLTPVGNGPTGGPSTSVAVDPMTRFVYASNSYAHTVAALKIDPATGALAPAGMTPAGLFANGIAVESLGKFAYVADQWADGVWEFGIDQTTGGLMQIGDVFAIPASCPWSVTPHPSAAIIYVVNPCSSNIVALAVDSSSGSLRFLGSPVPAGAWPISIALDPAGGFAYVANHLTADVSAYAVDSGGGLSPVGQRVPAGASPNSIAVAACAVAPVLSGISADPAVLWPPSRGMVPVTLSYGVAPRCGLPACTVTVEDSEAPQGSSDFEVIDPHHVALRAERAGSGGDRVYTITVSCTEGFGSINTASKSVSVIVPHDERVRLGRTAGSLAPARRR